LAGELQAVSALVKPRPRHWSMVLDRAAAAARRRRARSAGSAGGRGSFTMGALGGMTSMDAAAALRDGQVSGHPEAESAWSDQ
jgi:hypothetical protein